MGGDLTLFIQQLLATIDEGRRLGTHKLIALLALLDACALAEPGDDEALELPTSAIAASALRVLWRQTHPFEGTGAVLDQMAGSQRHAMVTAVLELRHAADRDGYRSVDAALTSLPEVAARATRRLEKVLVENPLPRLQTTGAGMEPFLFAPWEPMGTLRQLASAQGRENPVVQFFPGTANALVRLAPLLRPMVESAFVSDVARWNGLATEERQLRQRLFGAEREAWPTGLGEALHELQGGRCFYDGQPLRLSDAQIDHVLPWSRTSLNAITNLALARDSVNASKSDLLPSPDIVIRWSQALPDLADVAAQLGQPAGTDRTIRLARTTYRVLPLGTPLWRGRQGKTRQLVSYANHDRDRVLLALGSDGLATAAEDRAHYSPTSD